MNMNVWPTGYNNAPEWDFEEDITSKWFVACSYLTYRFNITTKFKLPVQPTTQVSSAIEIKQNLEQLRKMPPVALLLSSGIDSKILANFLPAGSKAYTIQFSEGQDETVDAVAFANQIGLPCEVVTIAWSDYLATTDLLIRKKHAPLHPVETALLIATQKIQADGFEQVVVGNGADSNFGGLDKLLASDWRTLKFIKRYSFVPLDYLKHSFETITNLFYFYTASNGEVDVPKFLAKVHGRGIIEAFTNASILPLVMPYESLEMMDLDLERIIKGEPKYLLRELFQSLYPSMPVPTKLPFVRPMDIWLKNWDGPIRPEFASRNMQSLSGEQKYMLWCLEKYFNAVDPV